MNNIVNVMTKLIVDDIHFYQNDRVLRDKKVYWIRPCCKVGEATEGSGGSVTTGGSQKGCEATRITEATASHSDVCDVCQADRKKILQNVRSVCNIKKISWDGKYNLITIEK